MSIWVNLLITTSLGAVIGGYTNHLAIQMLFRPHHPVYIGKFRVPFTPGLIPKRRDELAVQMGRMVVDHLLTPEGIERKLSDSSFQRDITGWVQAGAEKAFGQDISVREASQLLGISHLEEKAAASIERFVANKIEHIWDTYSLKTWEQVLPESAVGKVEEAIPKAAQFLVEKGVSYFESAEGKKKLSNMIDDFFASRGALLNLVGMFFGNDSLVERVQPEIIKFLRQDGTKELLQAIIEKEWSRLKQGNVNAIEAFISKEQLVQSITSFVSAKDAVASVLDQPVSVAIAPYKQMVIETWIPRLVAAVFQWFGANVPTVLERLRLSEIVQGEVATFSTERLEEMVLSITRKELKMITYLGALLGAVIGLVQGIVLSLLS